MQEEGTLSKNYPLVQLATSSKGSGQESEDKAATTKDDTVDSPYHVSPTQNKDTVEDVNDEVIPNTSSNVTLDSNTVAATLVSPCVCF